MRIVDEALLETFRAKQKCEWCGRKVYRCEAAHVTGKGMGGWRRIDLAINVLGLCTQCHADHHNGNRPLACDLLAVVAAREGMLQRDIEKEIYRLRRIPKNDQTTA